ncbi:MAG: 30S ribosomal protein S16 [Verrucomicrobia bacterium]|nr:30S ribosomal protein S16 [Verrucomicrobiota bacterium]
MAVKIRLRRMGSKNAAFYRVIVQDARRAPTGKFIETLGWYDPKQEGNNFSLNLDRADYWLGNGAQPSDTVASLIKKARTLPAEQAVAGEVTEEEVPVAAIEAEEAAEETAEEVPVAEEVAPAEEAKEPVAEEVAEAPVEEVAEASAAAEATSDEPEEEATKENA